MATMTEFANDSAAAHAIRAAAPQNGVYFSKYGVLAAVRITPTFTDLTAGTAIGPMLGKQLALDVIGAIVLVLLLQRIPAEGALRTGVTFALAAFAVSLVAELADSIWYGFAASYSIVNVVDQTICFFLVGAALAAVRKRMEPVLRTEERPVKAQGGIGTADKPVRV
jgi:hypothetical protein